VVAEADENNEEPCPMKEQNLLRFLIAPASTGFSPKQAA